MRSPQLFSRTAVAGALLLSAAAVAGCGSSSDASSGGKPVVAATAPQIDGLVRELAGDGVTVASVVAATADVHELELRPSQVRALKGADLILQPGRGNDAWASEALGQVDAKKVDLSAGLPSDQRHWWMDPTFAEQAATKTAAELDTLDPDGKATRATALKRFVAEMRAVDEETKRCIATVPAGDRVIVTDHDAAGAYAARYGLTVAATISPGAEPEAAPSASRIVELEKTMKAKNVTAVFPIAPHGSDLSSTIAERGGATLGEPLWADALPGATHDHEHGSDEHAAEEAEHAGEEHAGEDHTKEAGGDQAEPTLIEAAKRNGEAMAEALGGDAQACAPLLG
ncbi:MAG: metal ABC transporter substrate-binding protein [Solirubrobacteraceae bacterium]|nr:metal ABC transporter substrate-binding protein [Solirubrobacteraceae bacterium]